MIQQKCLEGFIIYISTDWTNKPSEGKKLKSWTGFTVEDATPRNNGTNTDTITSLDYVKISNSGIS